MSSFPSRKWEVRFLQDMNSMACSDPDREDKIKMEAFMAIKPSGGQEGSFRFVLSGNKPVKLRFNVESVIPSKLFGGMVTEGELKIGDQIEMDKNSVCSKWMDIVALVQSQDISISNGLGEDAADAFLAALEEYKKKLRSETGSADSAGICLRWILGTVVEDKEVILMVQVILIRQKIGSSKPQLCLPCIL